jgi:NAD(P)-dependent dehydrogenase (short-subunit alcohol dehydrogenase family)
LTIETVLITGAGNRLGLELAMGCAKAGKNVVLHARSNIDTAQQQAEAIRALGRDAAVTGCDLLDRSQVATLIASAAGAIGKPIDGLINNASIFEADLAEGFTNENWDRHFDIHVRAPCTLARDLALALPDGRKGSVVNIIDQRVFKLNPLFFTYTLSKSALASATKTLAQGLAPHVRVNGVAPGPILRNARQSESDFQKQVDATILGTGSPPIAVVEAAIWLLDAQTITGQILAVDGGQSLIWQTPDVDGIVE